MKREYWLIIIAYLGMHLSSLIAYPLFMLIGFITDIPAKELQVKSGAYWIIISFFITITIVLLLLRREMKESLHSRDGVAASSAVLWAIGGVFLAFFSQYAAGAIELALGIKPGSENTQQIVSLIEQVPLVMVVTSIVGPILEEIIFRKIIFGELYKRFNFFISALLSSIIFGIAHLELVHIILYSAMGFTFAYLYVKTKRILVPIFAHVTMNTVVVLIQLTFKDDIEKMMNDMEKVQSFIGGFL
ncbi:CPBP family intramembrane metalloprotease [Peribacillus saganii]|uniref:CPBP family intramembrane metalloprotease n=1 Tax=Peribacillus saganii TaxID=2303992 RepID=A0A372LPF7_9BACI|nr:CPBP family intramembrane glutamic endopeptidase [Peribacillus saganii]RFU69242.1 CPBP family intramembrane metalloprotease [Peribacillus saganii]